MACKLTARSSKRNENDSKSGKVIIVIDSLLFSCCLFVFWRGVRESVCRCLYWLWEREREFTFTCDWFAGSVAKLSKLLTVYVCSSKSVWPSLINPATVSVNVFCYCYCFCLCFSFAPLYMTRVRRISFCVLILGFLGVALPFLDCCCNC